MTVLSCRAQSDRPHSLKVLVIDISTGASRIQGKKVQWKGFKGVRWPKLSCTPQLCKSFAQKVCAEFRMQFSIDKKLLKLTSKILKSYSLGVLGPRGNR